MDNLSTIVILPEVIEFQLDFGETVLQYSFSLN